VMLTSLSAQPAGFDPKAVGIEGWLTKPVRQSQLFDVLIDAACRQHVDNARKIDVATLEPAITDKLGAEHQNADLKSRRNRARLLLAEDNEINQIVTLEILSLAGFHCDVSHNGREAIEKLREQPYDLVLMDCQMPEMDGFVATREIRRLESLGE